MIILGLGLLYFGFAKWKKNSGNAGIYGVIGLASLAVFFAVLLLAVNKKTSTADLMKKSEETRNKAIASIKEMDKPDFGNKEIDNHFTTFQTNLKQYKDAVAQKDTQAIKMKEEEYTKWNEQSVVLMQQLNTAEEKQKMALYLGKLGMEWQEIK
ncbi:hypothetical protein [Pedobacter punctiformis]|uniref:DUF4199 domain-containing protein n=1 Tax=Pedobacter punctiformis TaxID=3004097 RepID=A0ABT4LGJ5_9SPHI|nr:hypothetical protein [Pedobacter sp. HCMS5-2]MCZ4245924.1 hypothetical protein [Pedobacter sp. HCMS5-2]